MLLAIISDIHNNTVNLKKVLNYCKDSSIKTIICCGDLASSETLDFLNDNFSGEIHYCFGNMDNDQLKNYEFAEKYKNTFIYVDFGEIKVGTDLVSVQKNVAFTHYPEEAEKLALSNKYDFVFYGHTHKPWTEKIGHCILLNPGNVAGEIYPPTFAVWDVDKDKFELIRIHKLKNDN